MKNHKIRPIIGITIVFVVVLAVGVGYIKLTGTREGGGASEVDQGVDKETSEDKNKTDSKLRISIDEETLDTTRWKTYANGKYDISFKYPPGWSVKEGSVFPETSDYYDLLLVLSSPDEKSPLGTIQLKVTSYKKAQQYIESKGVEGEITWRDGVSPNEWEKDRTGLSENMTGNLLGYLYHVEVIKNMNDRKYLVRYQFYPSGGGVVNKYITYARNYRWELSYEFSERNDLFLKTDREISAFLSNLSQNRNVDVDTNRALLLLEKLTQTLKM